MPPLIDLMACRNIKASKTALLTLHHLQMKTSRPDYGLDLQQGADDAEIIKNYLRVLASVIAGPIHSHSGKCESLVLSLKLALKAYREVPHWCPHLDTCLGSHILDQVESNLVFS